MKQFLIHNKYRNEVLEWFASQELEFICDYNWIDFYQQEVLRFDIYKEDIASMFVLCWGDIIDDKN